MSASDVFETTGFFEFYVALTVTALDTFLPGLDLGNVKSKHDSKDFLPGAYTGIFQGSLFSLAPPPCVFSLQLKNDLH